MASSKSRFARPALALALVGAASFGLVAWTPARAQDPGKREHEEKGGEDALEHAMESMNGALKSMLKGIDATSRDKALEQIAKFQSNLLTAKLLTPPMAEKIDAAKRPEFVAGYRRKLVDVLSASAKVEAAILDGKYDEANKVVKEELTRLKKEGHDKYQEEKDEH
jgi:hypothetical protein